MTSVVIEEEAEEEEEEPSLLVALSSISHRSVAIHLPDSVSHSLHVLSIDPVAMREPS